MNFEYYNNILCVEVASLIDEGVISFDNYKKMSIRKQINVIRRACNNTPALVEWWSIPERFKNVIIEKFGDPSKVTAETHFAKHIRPNSKALEFFSNYLLQNGDNLPHEKQIEYYNNAIVLNAILAVTNDRRAFRKALGGKTTGVWNTIAETVLALDRNAYPHTLPINERRLKDKYKKYIDDGYQSLIHKSYCNSYARVVNKRLERLILSIYCMSNKPYSKWVHEDYLAFVAGVHDVVDMQTGEIFNRNEFWDENKDSYIMISEATCWNYINNPKNRAIVDAIRMDRHKYSGSVRPHHHRHAPRYALSKISLDDRDLPHKLPDGSRVKAYYAYDVASGVLLGAAYSLKKDTGLFIECMRDMFRFINAGGWGIPLEVEVEHHLVSNFKDDLMKAGLVFPFVRWCAPGNSQEKHAEQFNRQKKYGYEKRYQDGIGRFYARQEANQTGGERVYDENLNKYVIREKTYSFEQVVADDRAAIKAYNEGLHRNQKEYTKQSRMQVMLENINPNLAEINQALIVRYIGECTTTSIQRNMYCQVQYVKYMLPSPQILAKLAPHNYTVQAYWLPNSDTVYLYQNGNFIAECEKLETYNTALGERTDDDINALISQGKYIAQFDKMVRDGKNELAKPQFIKNIDQYTELEPAIAKTAPEEKPCEDNYSEYVHDIEYYKELAYNNL
jgi:hypothetical protein